MLFSKNLAFFFTLLTLLTLGWLIISKFPFSPTYPEIEQLKGGQMKFAELKEYFTNLANKKGAVYAYEVLKLAPMPEGTDMHLMGHVVGEVLYRQKGAEGMKYCTQDFRNACSHTIVVGLFLDKGEAALQEILDACKQAPGGPGAYMLCFHGLGHGVLAYTNYDFLKTVELCGKTGTKNHNFKEYGECVGGAVMEQISGGDHDKKTWSKQRAINLKGEDDPLYPCNSSILSDQTAKRLCYIYLTPHLFNMAGNTFGGKPRDEAIKKAFTYCELIPSDQQAFRKTCFGAFGKEFVVLAKDRDIRKIESMTDQELKKVIDWCMLANNKEAKESCISYALGSLFWSGENDPEISIRFCSMLLTGFKDSCFNDFISKIKQFIKDRDSKERVCKKMPQNYIQKCLEV